MSHDHSAKILAEHIEIDELLIQHQEALISQDFELAKRRYQAFHTLLREHIAFEDAHLLPLHQTVAEPRWRTLVYQAEHEKTLELAALMGERLEQVVPIAERPRLRWILARLDEQRSLKNLVEHHNEREEAGLLPELAALAATD